MDVDELLKQLEADILQENEKDKQKQEFQEHLNDINFNKMIDQIKRMDKAGVEETTSVNSEQNDLLLKIAYLCFPEKMFFTRTKKIVIENENEKTDIMNREECLKKVIQLNLTYSKKLKEIEDVQDVFMSRFPVYNPTDPDSHKRIIVMLWKETKENQILYGKITISKQIKVAWNKLINLRNDKFNFLFDSCLFDYSKEYDCISTLYNRFDLLDSLASPAPKKKNVKK